MFVHSGIYTINPSGDIASIMQICRAHSDDTDQRSTLFFIYEQFRGHQLFAIVKQATQSNSERSLDAKSLILATVNHTTNVVFTTATSLSSFHDTKVLAGCPTFNQRRVMTRTPENL